MAYQSTNPYNGQIVKSFDDIDDAELLIKLTAAQACFDQVWRHKGFAERKAVLSRAAALMRERTQEFAQLITLEMGKLIAQSEGEVKLSAAILDYYAEHAESFLAPEKLNTAKGDAVVESSPIGVLFGVEPWNYPYYQIVRFAAPNLMAGNVVMVKHASNVPQCALAFERLLEEAGAPAGAYTNLFITKDQVATVIDDDRIRAVALTGSEGAGAVVAQRAGKNLKKSTLELGGSDAFIVLEDADLDNAVKHAVSGRMGNSGQACTASKRFIVVEALADRFLEKFQTALQGFEAGDPMDRKTTLAPLSSAQALKTLLGQVDEAVSHGARIVMGGQRIEGQRGAFMQPTILTDIEADNPAYMQEFFGPVALFFRVPDEAAAVALANDSPFGLGGSVFTQDVERGKRVARQIDTGMVFINSAAVSMPDLPFGGVKNSGYGRELSGAGIQEFVNKKLIRVG
ncbi:NAD-dependent succinate-semialdehyde dehydrogenase [Hydrogenophaga sp.]|uniref:NAD-dependent succinate-semialdehyde dehydrogenase n=1 Tax=Hydrogenophaga sp. TaxID=1904254 RepID=UPI0025BA9944|nr:NAD-dependent succinate-semialdehyde dehydrogenase [Hydrogenophaga sp.]MDO9135507.1 NAD-dependent succinate-semialdehyde dehydrogenase [Hydrogenophaga sp.]MDO9506153.1 NAD-dependent succinate-semialdehyde dehydrogenase [Hydrogenophaga sp.]MDP3627355.1 NAD-dependent succinate-semialdehyde dehydrogenase [Hydrogenophaga sp.]